MDWRWLPSIYPEYARRDGDPRRLWRFHAPCLFLLVLVDAVAWRHGYSRAPPLPLAGIVAGHLALMAVYSRAPLFARCPVAVSTALTVYNVVASVALAALTGDPTTPLWVFHFLYVVVLTRACPPSYLLTLLLALLPLASGLAWHALDLVPLSTSASYLGTISIAGAVGYASFASVHRGVRERALDDEAKGRREATLAERQRIARDLHDTLGAALSEALLWHEVAQGAQGDEARRALEKAQARTRGALEELRACVRGLDEGNIEGAALAALLRDRVEGLCAAAGVRVALDLRVDAVPTPFAEGYHLLKLVEEATSNALRHGRPAHLTVTIVVAEELRVVVEDDGGGFDAAGAGPRSLRERAQRLRGALEVRSGPGGTLVSLVAPRAAGEG